MEVFRDQSTATHVVLPLVNTNDRPSYLSDATIVNGDVTILRYTGGTWDTTNLSSLPTQIGSSGFYDFSITAEETNPDDTQYPIVVKCSDQDATKQWDDNGFVIWTRPVAARVGLDSTVSTLVDGTIRTLDDLWTNIQDGTYAAIAGLDSTVTAVVGLDSTVSSQVDGTIRTLDDLWTNIQDGTYAAIAGLDSTVTAVVGLDSTVSTLVDGTIRTLDDLWTNIQDGTYAAVIGTDSTVTATISTDSTVTALIDGSIQTLDTLLTSFNTTTIDSGVDFTNAIKYILSHAYGDIGRSGDDFAYKDSAGSSTLFTLTRGVSGRTRS